MPSLDLNALPLKNILKQPENLPTLPGIVLKIIEAVNNENTNLEDLGEILSLDPPLSGKILGLINSSFYALPVEITSVSHAVKLLGFNTVKKVALSFSLLKLARPGKDDFNYVEFWRNSVMAAVVCRFLAKKVLPPLAEDSFTLGLLHDIGRLGLNQSMPKQYNLVLKEQRDTQGDFYEAEKKILGFTHMELSGILIKQWGLPLFFREPAESHHLPEVLETFAYPMGLLGKVLFLANQVVEYFSGSRKTLSLGILKSYLARWGFDQQIHVDTLIEEAHRQTKEISGLFEIRLKEENEYLELIEKARQELIQISDLILQEMLVQQNRVKSLQDEVMQDGLTGLFNYKSFHYFLTREYDRAKRYQTPLTLIIADIDYFKSVNDTFGHSAGDKVLQAISQQFNNSLRNSDIVARHGGEEFGILLTNTSFPESLAVVERLRQSIENLEVKYEGRVVKVTMSFGVAWLQLESDLSQEQWVKRADQAMYEAKCRGRNRICVDTCSPTGSWPQAAAGRS
ncbi:MAG: GGDEF domain-containing protein [Deltaproteobacteria bacterium]|nr:GGDEF domain-containing protein [Deltaproteobacteria bacterium]